MSFEALRQAAAAAVKRKDCAAARTLVRSMLLAAKSETQRDSVMKFQNAARRCGVKGGGLGRGRRKRREAR